jgi:prepilin-type N-terminal cleavage/methylation domain-containing protein
MDRRKGRGGFTLVEVLFAIAVGVLLLSAIYVAIQSGQRSSGAIEAKTSAQQDVRAALELISLEVGMASYKLPQFTSSIWLNSSCSGSGTSAYKGIQEATAFAITFEMDINDNGVIAGGSNEVIRYAYDAPNQRITRITNCLGGAQPFLGNTAGQPRAVRVVNDKNGNGAYDDGTDIPVFRYFDGQGNQIAYAGLPAAIPSIRRIDITIAVETEGRDANTGQRRNLIYSTSVIPRNHALGY